MAYRSFWLVPERFIGVVVSATPAITEHTDEFKSFDSDMNRMLASVDQAPNAPLVHKLVYYLPHIAVPPLTNMVKFTFPEQPKLGWNLTVATPTPGAKITLSIAPQLAKLRSRYFVHPEDALNFMQEVDSTLPDLAPFAKAAGLDIDFAQLKGKSATDVEVKSDTKSDIKA